MGKQIKIVIFGLNDKSLLHMAEKGRARVLTRQEKCRVLCSSIICNLTMPIFSIVFPLLLVLWST